MIKRFLTLLAVALLVTGVAGCNPRGPEVSLLPTTEAITTAVVTAVNADERFDNITADDVALTYTVNGEANLGNYEVARNSEIEVTVHITG